MSNPVRLTDALDHLHEAIRFLELVHMAVKELETFERGAIRAGLDAATDRICAAQLIVMEAGHD